LRIQKIPKIQKILKTLKNNKNSKNPGNREIQDDTSIGKTLIMEHWDQECSGTAKMIGIHRNKGI
jgi:hypothetical protein